MKAKSDKVKMLYKFSKLSLEMATELGQPLKQNVHESFEIAAIYCKCCYVQLNRPLLFL